MPQRGTGLTAITGKSRRDDRSSYDKLWREQNREKSRAYHRNYYHAVTKKNPEKLRGKHASGTWSRRKSKYGLTKVQYLQMLDAQGGKCYICHEEHGCGLRVDHNHTTLRVRALLCSNCNTAIGQIKEDPSRLRAAADYIEQHTEKLGE